MCSLIARQRHVTPTRLLLLFSSAFILRLLVGRLTRVNVEEFDIENEVSIRWDNATSTAWAICIVARTVYLSFLTLTKVTERFLPALDHITLSELKSERSISWVAWVELVTIDKLSSIVYRHFVTCDRFFGSRADRVLRIDSDLKVALLNQHLF